MISFLRPDWPAPAQVRAASTLRHGGFSRAPYESLNLGAHVGDAPEDVRANRRALTRALALGREPLWLTQVHGTAVADADAAPGCEADAVVATRPGEVCAVLTADCLPVLFTTVRGDAVAAAHAGWRGLYAGVLERTVERMGAGGADILAWLGPAIGPSAFEVGNEVREAFVEKDEGAAAAFAPSRPGHWLADLYRLARRRLESVGVMAVYGGGLCTFSEPERFFSYRRDGRTGRMASLVWIEPAAHGGRNPSSVHVSP